MAIHLRPRDRELLKAVNDFQVLNIKQLEMMFFKSYSRACDRVSQLVSAGFLVERYISQVASAPAASLRVFTLGTSGKYILADTYGYTTSDFYRGGKQLSNPESLKHLLAINNIVAPIYRTCADNSDIELIEWRGERVFRAKPDYTVVENNQIKTPVYPDGFLHLQAKLNHNYFIEADNATEGLKQVKSQMKIHESFYWHGDYKKIYNAPSLRVLWVTTNRKRIKELQTLIMDGAEGTLHLFSTYEQMQPHSVLFDPIWYEGKADNKRPLIQW